MPEQGFLIISDITGYSSYLHASELEHAQDSLTDLINLLIEYTRSPLVISKLEGDAVFSYAPKGGFNQGQTLLEMIETTYLAFRKALELMIINTTCNCRACRNLPTLDLKFFIHYGTFSIQKMGDFQELVGNDVILVHRMLKNKITPNTGLKAYAAYCQAVIDVFNMEEMVANMVQHRESFTDVGEVNLYIQDMQGVWEKRHDEVRIVVDPEEAIHTGEFNFDIPQAVLWDYVTNPYYRTLLYSSESQKIRALSDGRITLGSVYVCAHGDSEELHTVLDWQPFDQYTSVHTSLGGATNQVTTKLEPHGEGTKLTLLISKSHGKPIPRAIMNFIYGRLGRWILSHYVPKLRRQIGLDLSNGNTVVPQRIEFGNELASKAAAESLVDNAVVGS